MTTLNASRHILSPDQYTRQSRQFMQELAIRCVVSAPITVTASAATTADPAVVTKQVRLTRFWACARRLGFSAVLMLCMLHSRIFAVSAVIRRRVINTSCKAMIQHRPPSTAPRWTRQRSRAHGHHTREFLPPRGRTSTSLRLRRIVRFGGRRPRYSATDAFSTTKRTRGHNRSPTLTLGCTRAGRRTSSWPITRRNCAGFAESTTSWSSTALLATPTPTANTLTPRIIRPTELSCLCRVC